MVTKQRWRIFVSLMLIIAGLALIAGWQTRLVAFLLAGLTLVICLYMNDFWNVNEGTDQQHEMQNFIKNLGIFAVLLLLAAHGAPRVSLDARSGRA